MAYLTRPTALIRRLLMLESFEEHLTGQIRLVKREMADAEIDIIDRKTNPYDIWIAYKHGGHFDEAIYMRKMLDAETDRRAERSGLLS